MGKGRSRRVARRRQMTIVCGGRRAQRERENCSTLLARTTISYYEPLQRKGDEVARDGVKSGRAAVLHMIRTIWVADGGTLAI